MSPGSRRAGAEYGRRGGATAAFTLVALALGGIAGYLVGGPRGRDATIRGIEIQELPVGSLGRENGLELPPLAPGSVHNVILMIGDGLGVAQIEAARLAAFGPDGRFVFEKFPATGLVSTHAANAPITESAAAATALASGVATALGHTGTAADGRRLVTLLEAARDAGFVTALITTSSLTDATPAAFAAHVGRRDEEEEIALELAESGFDLLIGGGREHLLPPSAGGVRSDGRDLVAEAAGRGIGVSSGAASFDGALPLWELRSGRPDKAKEEPPIAAWTESALKLLSEEATRRGAGIFAVIEEEGVDTAGHSHRIELMVRALLRFDAAVAAAARFAATDGSTLVIVVGDHSTGGLSIDSTTRPDRLRVAWSSAHHAGEPVPVYAYGPADAAARFVGYSRQPEIARRLAEVVGLDLSSNWRSDG